MVDARPYPRENIGNRAYAACKYFLRIVEARSYPRESTGNRAYITKYWETFDTAANSLRMFHNKIFRPKIKKKLSQLVLKRPKMMFLSIFSPPAGGKFWGFG